ncbi:MAG: hypothetical protein IJB68_05415 [Ruminococcus sp.]|nr:hypothetical protein [Ruminococcus sp.]
MNINNFPDEKEWKKIVEDAFSSDEEHIFSEHYKLNKQQMLRRVTMTKKTFNKKRGLAVIAAAVAVTAAIPLSVFAYEKLTAKIEKTGNYENTILIQTPVADTENTEAPKYMFYEFGWIPEGYVPHEENSGFKNPENGGRIAPDLYKLPDDTNVELKLPYSENCETYESEGKTALINYRSPNVYNKGTISIDRSVYICFEGTTYVLTLLISEDVSEADMKKIIDEITLYPTEEKLHGDYIPWLDKSNYQSASYSPKKFYAYEENVRTIGDTASNPYTGNGVDGYDVTLNSFELTDSFDGITTDGCGDETDFSHLMDENGNIIENIRTTIKLGDGVNTIDEIISEEVVPMHILKMNVTITNTADIENDICICPTMFIIEDGEPKADWVNNKAGYSCFDSLVGYDVQRMWFSLAMDSDQKGGKNHLILAPNESADVQIAFFVDDNVKDKVYVSFDVSGNNFGEYFDVNG